MAISTKDIKVQENPDGFGSESLPARKSVGRPKGSKNATTLLKEAAVERSEAKLAKNLNKIVDVVVQQAKDGDLVAAKMVWETFFKKASQSENDRKGFGGITINVSGGSTSERAKNITIEGTSSEEARSADGTEYLDVD
jgi:hypothetical protein